MKTCGWEFSAHRYTRLLHISGELYGKWVSNHFINGEEIGIVDRHSALCIIIIIMPLHNRVIRNNITILVYDKLDTELNTELAVTLVALVVKIIIALML